ncbi:MAG: AhpC/TSA family protein [Candidatus Omnitrophica bacterium]|nr:AhpC/TSA family protein [Candidatus Omnitrophota bacterium]MCA9435834.1 AhpC/TSA family protein [Candidatus Omnitrophota bacterium]MCA9440779.1 AhpC/TSA family protein [Candidatus Omnitrophota bacterium]MCA9447395.1 AhpC/TSA family protein [Candidatus Omnitrophota bacterium]MCB9766618.1 AhpC/TSA family protein [Candidatus Omnitrophota bacterium]
MIAPQTYETDLNEEGTEPSGSYRESPRGSLEQNSLWDSLSDFKTQNGKDLLALTHEKPVLLVFLRHLGCTFCREALSDVASRKKSLSEKGIEPVFVHMSDDEAEVQALFAQYGVEDCSRVSDPQRNLYRAFGLRRGTILQVLGPKVMWRGFVSAILKGYGFGMPKQDPLQLPGIFLLHHGKVLKDFRHETSADHPDYDAFGQCKGCE